MFFEEYLDLLDSFRRKKLSLKVIKLRESILSSLQGEHFSPKLQAYLKDMNAQGEPFTNFSHEPAQVSQIKKLINALHHAEVFLKDLETVNLRDWSRKVQDLVVLYDHTVHHIYQAAHHITHLDVDLRETFSHELAALAPVMEMFHTHAGNYKKETNDFIRKMGPSELPHKLGVIAGIAVDQLQPQGGEVDYEFLTQFTAVIPKYLDDLSLIIKGFSEQASKTEPNLDKRTLDELQTHALKLLQSLQSAQGSTFLMPLKVLQYIRIVKHTASLALSIVDQIKNVGDSSQDALRENLEKLKYEALPALFGFIDKIEEQSMLKPGTLSQPLMVNVKSMPAYQVVT